MLLLLLPGLYVTVTTPLCELGTGTKAVAEKRASPRGNGTESSPWQINHNDLQRLQAMYTSPSPPTVMALRDPVFMDRLLSAAVGAGAATGADAGGDGDGGGGGVGGRPHVDPD